jgi:hypothetical protein
MPSTYRTRIGVVLGALIVGYAVFVGRNVLVGVLLATLVYLVAWLIQRVSSGHPFEAMSRARAVTAGGAVLVVLAYSVVVAGNVLIGVAVATTVVLVAWLTTPVGPVARWLDGSS